MDGKVGLHNLCCTTFYYYFQQTLLCQEGISRSDNVHVCPSHDVIGQELSIPILICMNYD